MDLLRCCHVNEGLTPALQYKAVSTRVLQNKQEINSGVVVLLAPNVNSVVGPSIDHSIERLKNDGYYETEQMRLPPSKTVNTFRGHHKVFDKLSQTPKITNYIL